MPLCQDNNTRSIGWIWDKLIKEYLKLFLEIDLIRRLVAEGLVSPPFIVKL